MPLAKSQGSRRAGQSWIASRCALTSGYILASALLVCALQGETSFAQKSSAAQAPVQSIEGDWLRTDSSGSGSFGGLSDKFSKAALTPAGAAMFANNRRPPTGPAYTETRPHAAGDPYIVVAHPCANPFNGGALGINPDSNAIHIIVQKDEVIIAPERGGIRRIFTDGRAHPALKELNPTGSGHGIGHFEGKTFVADTIGLNPAAVPAGGWRTPETHLGERFEVSPDGQHLTIHYTWTDPKIYVTPHSYEYTFDRLPAGSYALEDWCDASDPKEQQSIVIPEQK